MREARQAILDGTRPLETLLNEKVGEIKATIVEKDGKKWLEDVKVEIVK